MSDETVKTETEIVKTDEPKEVKTIRDKMGWLDKTLGKYASRKLFVFLITTFLLCFSVIGTEVWLIVACAYIGTQAFIDGMAKLKAQ